jgi:hypothetical protein
MHDTSRRLARAGWRSAFMHVTVHWRVRCSTSGWTASIRSCAKRRQGFGTGGEPGGTARACFKCRYESRARGAIAGVPDGEPDRDRAPLAADAGVSPRGGDALRRNDVVRMFLSRQEIDQYGRVGGRIVFVSERLSV